ncbi:MAG: alanine/ornithine racemase family PLP-dependent enzyme [Synergistaceae bacterium]|nr:alanine/ornithine racemase family PLP-dependent enzyme [Synergistaceae bacterium]
MPYPVLRVHLDIMENNITKIVLKAAEHGISVWAVTKGLSAPLQLARMLSGTKVSALADSRIMNIRRIKEDGIKTPLALIRIPMPSEINDVIELADYSLVSDLGTLELMSKACESKKKEHSVLLMADMGDLREGFWPDKAEAIAAGVKNLSPALNIVGIGVNYGCASGVLPSRESMEKFVSFGEKIESELGKKLEIYSGGATTRSLIAMDEGLFPERVNNLRIGEGYLLGSDKSSGVIVPWLRQDTMELEAELVEVRRKPTKPIGEVGRDAFGNVPCFEDRGDRLRGILAIGRQDVNIGGLTPLEEGVKIITASSDHLLVDMEECPAEHKVGGILRFKLDYPAMLSSSTSPYVTKIYEGWC